LAASHPRLGHHSQSSYGQEKEKTMKFRSTVGAFALASGLLLAASSPVSAQSLQAFNIERKIALNNILSQITPNIPASVLAALAGGALEVREVMAYNPQANALTSTVFAVPTGSPIPTPAAVLANLGNTILEVSTTTPDKIYVTVKPFMSVMFVGSVTQSTNTPYGNYQGAVANASVGFTSDTPPKVNTVVESIAGALVVYSPDATVKEFTVTLPSSGGGGGGTSANPTVVIAGGTNQTTLSKVITLDASGSTDPNNLALSYQWTVTGNQSVSLQHANSAIANAELGTNGPATYTFMVTVTDTAGKSASATVTVNYVGR
jgi:hypothetical protein